MSKSIKKLIHNLYILSFTYEAKGGAMKDCPYCGSEEVRVVNSNFPPAVECMKCHKVFIDCGEEAKY